MAFFAESIEFVSTMYYIVLLILLLLHAGYFSYFAYCKDYQQMTKVAASKKRRSCADLGPSLYNGAGKAI